MAAETTVRELLESKEDTLHTIGPDALVFDALRAMVDAKIGALLVMEGDKLAGIFSERDYARKIILEGKSSKGTKVRDVMTAEVCCVSPEQSLRECMALMNRNRFRHLPVIQEEKVVGIVSIGDVVRAILMSML